MYLHFKIIILTLLLATSTSATKWIPSYAGPYRVILKQFVNLSKEDAGTQQFWIRAYVQSYRPGHPQYMHGRVVNTIPLTDDYQIVSYTDIRSNNHWKKNAFIIKFPHFCTDATKYALSELTLLFGEDAKKCPIPVGDRIIKNQTVNLSYPDFPIFPYGRWLITTVLKDKKGNPIGGTGMDVETIPKV